MKRPLFVLAKYFLLAFYSQDYDELAIEHYAKLSYKLSC